MIITHNINGRTIFLAQELKLIICVTIFSCHFNWMPFAGNSCVLFICAKLNKDAGLYAIYYASLAVSDLLLSGPCLIPQVRFLTPLS